MKDDGLGNIPYDIRLQLAQSKARDDLAKQTGSWSGDYDYGKSDQIQAANGHYEEYMRTLEPGVELRMPNGVILPIEENKYKQVQYDRYQDDMQNAIEDKALQKGIEAIPLATVVAPGLKGGRAMMSAGKVIPGIGLAFAANDAVNGYTTADRTFNNPDIVEKLSNASATVGNGLSLGLLPIDKSAKGLASLVNGKYYGTLDDIVPDENRMRQINNVIGLGKIN